LEPALRPIAEGLKIGLCQEEARRQRLGLAPDPDLHRQFPGRHNVRVNGRTLSLTNPALTSEAFAAVVAPFIDRNMLAPRSDECRTSRSIFAPVDDAIERSGLRHDEIDVFDGRRQFRHSTGRQGFADGTTEGARGWL
jgi:molecular chaperone DnaK